MLKKIKETFPLKDPTTKVYFAIFAMLPIFFLIVTFFTKVPVNEWLASDLCDSKCTSMLMMGLGASYLVMTYVLIFVVGGVLGIRYHYKLNSSRDKYSGAAAFLLLGLFIGQAFFAPIIERGTYKDLISAHILLFAPGTIDKTKADKIRAYLNETKPERQIASEKTKGN